MIAEAVSVVFKLAPIFAVSGFGYEAAIVGFFAVVAFEAGLVAQAAHVEAAGNGLAVAGAVGVGAAEDFADGFGQPERHFLLDFEVGDEVYRGFGGEQGEAVGGGFVEPDTVDFDDVFSTVPFAGQVEADGYGAAFVQ